MKKVSLNILLLQLFLLIHVNTMAQGDIIKPTFGVTIEKEVYLANIENKKYEKRLIVELKAAELKSFLSGVKVVVKDPETKKKIFSKRFSKAYLYYHKTAKMYDVGKGDAISWVHLIDVSYGEWVVIINSKGI